MIPDFDIETGYLPSGCHECCIEDIKNKFVDEFPESDSRTSRFNGFIEYSKYICSNVKSTRKQLINGSFTTNKINPHDIDFVIIINGRDMTPEEEAFLEKERAEELLRKQIYQLMKTYVKQGIMDINELHCCDSYIIVRREDDEGKLYDDWLKDKDYWLNCWGHSRPDKETGVISSKGIINLEMNDEAFEGV